MRILQLCTNFRPGGIQRHALDLADYMRSQGHNVMLAGDRGAWAPEDSEDYIPLELDRIASTGGSVFKRLSEILPVARALRKAIKSANIEMIHAHESAPAIVARLATMGLRIPVVLTYHGSEPGRVTSFARTAKRCADWTISPSRASLDSLIAAGLPEVNTRVMGLGVHPLPAVNDQDIKEFRQSLLGEKGKFLISSLSRLDHQKGIDMMIEVARKIQDQRDDVVFVVGGHGPYEDLVDSWAEVAQVSDSIKFLGPVSDVEKVLAASDIYLLTSRWEALPISIVEAFRTGLPVVATDCGGVRELVDQEVGAVLDVGDTNGLSRTVVDLIEDTELRTKMASNAKLRSTQDRFLPSHVHQGYENLYQEIIATG